MGNQIITLDDGLVFLTVDWGMEYENMAMMNTLNLYHFDANGALTHTYSHNISNTPWVIEVELLRTFSRHSAHRLQNGKVLVGGHGIGYDLDNKLRATPPIDHNSDTLFPFQRTPQLDSSHKARESVYVNPLIITLSPDLTQVLHVDTLERVESYGAITLIYEVAPDTLIIGYDKTYPSQKVLMETDSLFNIRWSTEFGFEEYWYANIHDFAITSEGDYLFSMDYIWVWYGVGHAMGIRKNVLHKLDRHDGQQLWKKEIWKNKGYNIIASLAPYQDNKFLIALDDCCIKAPPDGTFAQIIFHEHTGMHLQVRNNDGEILEEKNLAPFLWNFANAFEGPSAEGYPLEDPENAYPWFLPQRIQYIAEDDSYLITGVQYSSDRRRFGRGFLLKVDAELQPIYTRIFEIDKRDYIYANNKCILHSIRKTPEGIFLGGTFESAPRGSITSPYYQPNYPWNMTFQKNVFIPLDEYGCYQPGCHLTDNVPYYELEQAIRLSPNPARDQVRIHVGHKALHDKDKVLFISDMQGRQMLSKRFSASEITVSTAAFPEGIYLVYVMSRGQVFRAEKLVVR